MKIRAMRQLIVGLIVLSLLQTISHAQNYEFQTKVDMPILSDPDKYGYRYCSFWKTGNGIRVWSDCDPYETMRCGKKMDFEYRCCTQFLEVREEVFPLNVPSGLKKCARVIPQWDFCPNVMLKSQGYGVFGDHLRYGDFVSESTTKTFTIFAPYTSNENQINDIYGKYKDSKEKNPILHHVINNRLYAADLKNGMTLDTLAGTKLKVSKYSHGVTCIDCVELIEVDLECKNGLVHKLRKPLISPKGLTNGEFNNVYQLLKSNPKTKSFANDISPELQKSLENVASGIWYTIFAPTEESWLKLRTIYTESSDRQKIVSNHILSQLICSSGIISNLNNLPTMGGSRLQADCMTVSSKDIKGQFREKRVIYNDCGEKVEILEEDLTAPNGVVHVIADPVTPLNLRKLQDLFSCASVDVDGKMGFKKFAEFIKDCDLRMENGKKYAVLLPMDYAFDWWKDYAKFKPEYDRFMTDKEYRCRVARYHITAFNDKLGNITLLTHQNEGYKSNTIDLRWETNYFLKDKSQSDMYFHYSPVVNFEANEFADGTFYKLKRINVIPEKTIIEQISLRDELSNAKEKLLDSKFEEKVFTPDQPLNLYLAARNTGWKTPAGITKMEYTWEKEELIKLNLLHTVPNYLWGDDIGYFKKNTIHKFMSKIGIELTFWMDDKGVMRIGHDGMGPMTDWPKVVEFNIPATDGIIWVLDGLLLCPQPYCKRLKMDVYLVFVAACINKHFGPTKKDMTGDFKKKPYEVSRGFTDNCAYFQQSKKRVPDLD